MSPGEFYSFGRLQPSGRETREYNAKPDGVRATVGLFELSFEHIAVVVGASPAEQVTPSALGTSGDYATIFYWLDGHGDLKQHIGHRVEVEGDLKGDVKDGEITTERKDNWTDVTVKADGRTMKAHVPNTSIFPACN